jgi:hypothetical protein
MTHPLFSCGAPSPPAIPARYPPDVICATHLARDVSDVDNGAQELIDFESTLPSPVAELIQQRDERQRA